MSEVMNGYQLLMPFNNKEAGFSRWTLAVQGEKKIFLKEFLNPVYPLENALSDKIRQQRIEACEEFEKKKKRLYSKINEVSDGNIVRIREFFRCDSHYYIATDRIDSQDISYEELQKYPIEERLLLCRIIAHAVMKLHSSRIVHADLKASNILLKVTQNQKLTAKIIDFDCSFIEDDPPQYEDELGGDQVYLAPEACLFMCGEPVQLTCKIDVFSLGLIFHQILSGKLPWFDPNEYDYAFDAVLDRQQLEIASKLDQEIKDMLKKMLVLDADERITMQEVFQILKKNDEDSSEEETASDREESGSDGKEEKDTNGEQNSSPAADPWFHEAGDL